MLEQYFSYYPFEGCFYFLDDNLQEFAIFQIFSGRKLYLNDMFWCKAMLIQDFFYVNSVFNEISWCQTLLKQEFFASMILQ